MDKQDLATYSSLLRSFGEIKKALDYCAKLIPIKKCFNSDRFWEGIERRRIYRAGKESFDYTISQYQKSADEVKGELKRRGFDGKCIDTFVEEFKKLKD